MTRDSLNPLRHRQPPRSLRVDSASLLRPRLRAASVLPCQPPLPRRRQTASALPFQQRRLRLLPRAALGFLCHHHMQEGRDFSRACRRLCLPASCQREKNLCTCPPLPSLLLRSRPVRKSRHPMMMRRPCRPLHRNSTMLSMSMHAMPRASSTDIGLGQLDRASLDKFDMMSS